MFSKVFEAVLRNSIKLTPGFELPAAWLLVWNSYTKSFDTLWHQYTTINLWKFRKLQWWRTLSRHRQLRQIILNGTRVKLYIGYAPIYLVELGLLSSSILGCIYFIHNWCTFMHKWINVLADVMIHRL